MDEKPRVAVLALGGTIAMVKGDEGGVRPGLGAEDLIAAAPGIDAIAELRAETVSKIGSSDLTVPAVLAVARRIEELAGAGEIDGAVVTQGTDTMEETSFLLDLVLNADIPVVFTGAMRNPLSVSHDGPGNVLAAVRVAADPTVRAHAHSIGVLVAMLDSIHAAANVMKATSTRVDAFASPESGPVGVLVEDRVRLISVPNRDYRTALEAETEGGVRLDDNAIPPVALHTFALGESGGLLDALVADPNALGYAGLVLGATGGGHVPAWLVGQLEALAKRMPVAMAGRMQAGYLLAKTYERAGSEIDLLNRGIVSAGRLPPLKARLLLTVMLAAGLDAEAQERIWSTVN